MQGTGGGGGEFSRDEKIFTCEEGYGIGDLMVDAILFILVE